MRAFMAGLLSGQDPSLGSHGANDGSSRRPDRRQATPFGRSSATAATYEGRPLCGDNQLLSAQGQLVTSDALASVPVTAPRVQL
jgi:hypothetical protein